MINKILIPHIEKALGIKLYDNVISYLTQNKSIYIQNSRRYGKTTSHIIKFILDNKFEFIYLDDLMKGNYTDEIWDTNYISWYTREFLEMWHRLKIYGFKVINIKHRDGSLSLKGNKTNVLFGSEVVES